MIAMDIEVGDWVGWLVDVYCEQTKLYTKRIHLGQVAEVGKSIDGSIIGITVRPLTEPVLLRALGGFQQVWKLCTIGKTLGLVIVEDRR